MVSHKDQKLSEKLETPISGDLIAFGNEFLKKELGISVTKVEGGAGLIDLLTGCEEDTSIADAIGPQPDHSDILIDLRTDGTDEVLEVARTSDDLAVLVTDFPIWSEHSKSQDPPAQITIFRDPSDIVQILSKGYGQLIKKRFESANIELADKKTGIENLGNKVQLMQPLYDIGLTIRKRRLEVANGKAEKDRLVITEGNSAAHHSNALADATFMIASPLEQRFKELYNDIPPQIVWEHKRCTVFLDMLNWKLDMSLFSPFGGVDKKAFNKLFDSVFPRIYPSLKTCDKMLEQNKNLRDALAGMKAEHSRAHERDVQTHRTNRGFLKAQQRVTRQTQTS